MSRHAPATRSADRAPGVGGRVFARALDVVERIGNRLPDPITIFVILALVVLAGSWLAARLGVSAVHPKDGSVITAVNLLNAEGVRRIFTEAVRNFMNFAPLGIVLTAMIGIGVAEKTGLIAVSLRAFMTGVPRTLLTAAVIFAGMMAHLAADAGIIILPPIAALLFAAAGRHPLAGFIAAYAAVSGAFSANVLPSPLDVLLIGFTQEAAKASKLLPGYEPQVLGNYYFLAVTAPVLTIVGTWITHRFIEPRLGPWQAQAEHVLGDLTAAERRGLRAAGVALAASVALVLALVLPAGAPLRAAGPTLIAQLKPFFDSIVALITLLFFVPGLAYGIASGKIRNDRDVAKMSGETVATMGTYIVLAFAAAQFISYFAWSNLGGILAISGAGFLKGLGLQGGLLLVGFVFFSGFFDLFITSASAKWAIMAPVFVPMFALLGFTPECTQVVFRIGASVVNIITPCFPYLPIILVAARRYDPKMGVGTLIAMMVPYSLAFLVSWVVLMLVFYALHWPIGPGVMMRLPG